MLESFILANTNHFLKSKWTFQINCKIYFSAKNIKKNRKKNKKKTLAQKIKKGELGEVRFGMMKFIELGEMSFGMLKIV